MVTHGNENACEREEYTSNSSSLSKMGWVAVVSSLCLDCREIYIYIYIYIEGGNKCACGVGCRKAP